MKLREILSSRLHSRSQRDIKLHLKFDWNMTSPQIAEMRGREPVFITVINTSEDVAYQERSENISRLRFKLKN
jgi:hypothetical protein